jgi:L-asparagine transporter-like permease
MYITFIFLIKIGFIVLAISHLYLKIKHKENTETDKKILYWKERFEFIFIALMAVLLIYLFNPRTDRSVIIDKETKILLYLFGFILILTAKWEIFFHESKLLNYIQQIAK